MTRIFITGSTQGVGRNAAETLIAAGHEVVLHARNERSAKGVEALAAGALGIVTGDLGSLAETRNLAKQLNSIGRMDAIIHNAGIIDDDRMMTEDGLLRVLMVNAIAPFLLSTLASRPKRLIFTGSSMHHGHDQVLDDMNWTSRRWSGSSAYGESKLLGVALANGLARGWPDVHCNSVDPGWVPTRMGGRAASDDLNKAHMTQCWLATSSDAEACVSGVYWYHLRPQEPDPKVRDPKFQAEVLKRFAELTQVSAG